MTTYSNTAGNLDKKIILSFPYDPERPDTNSQLLVDAPGKNMSSFDDGDFASFSETVRAGHWQDTISDTIRATSYGAGDLPVDALTHLQDPSQNATSFVSAGTNLGGYDIAKDTRQNDDLTVANEFELDVNSLTHTFQTMTAIGPLPGMPKRNLSDMKDTSQLNALSIDLGMMREVITVQGILIDRVNHPSSTSTHHMRRQHLLDIVRSQYGFIHGLSQSGKDASMMNVNRFPALTIGPIYGRTAGKDEDYEGSEPSDDVRGYDVAGSYDSPSNGQDTNASENGVAVAHSWWPSPSYKGRNRYRGLIIRCNVANQGGRPDIWQYSFEFVVIKNEMSMRLSTNFTNTYGDYSGSDNTFEAHG